MNLNSSDHHVKSKRYDFMLQHWMNIICCVDIISATCRSSFDRPLKTAREKSLKQSFSLQDHEFVQWMAAPYPPRAEEGTTSIAMPTSKVELNEACLAQQHELRSLREEQEKPTGWKQQVTARVAC